MIKPFKRPHHTLVGYSIDELRQAMIRVEVVAAAIHNHFKLIIYYFHSLIHVIIQEIDALTGAGIRPFSTGTTLTIGIPKILKRANSRRLVLPGAVSSTLYSSTHSLDHLLRT